jgi:hypothetical protein
MGKRRNADRMFIGKLEGKKSCGKYMHRWEDNIKMDCKEIGWYCGDWIHMTQDRFLW